MWSPAPHSEANSEVLRGQPAGGRDGADAALEAGDALLERGDGRVADPGVDVAVLLQGEAGRGIRGVVEHERTWSGRSAARARRSPRPGCCRRELPGCGIRIPYLPCKDATASSAAGATVCRYMP